MDGGEPGRGHAAPPGETGSGTRRPLPPSFSSASIIYLHPLALPPSFTLVADTRRLQASSDEMRAGDAETSNSGTYCKHAYHCSILGLLSSYGGADEESPSLSAYEESE